MKEKFQIIIKNLEEGKTLTNAKTDCIICITNEGEGMNAQVITCCNGNTLLNAINALNKTSQNLQKQVAKDMLSAGLMDLLNKLTEGDDDE